MLRYLADRSAIPLKNWGNRFPVAILTSWILLGGLAIGAPSEEAKPDPLVRGYAHWKADFLKQPGCAGASVGLWLADDSGRLIFGDAEETNFIPASALKVVTACAILEKVEPQTQLVTRLVWDARRKELALVGGGDPELSSKQLADMASLVSHRLAGIPAIKLWVDSHIFPEAPFPAGWSWDDFSEPYGAEVRGLTVDKGWSTVHLKNTGEGLPVQVDAPEWFGPIANLAVGGADRTVQWFRLPGTVNTVVVGSVPAGPPLDEKVTFADSDLAAGRNLALALQANGVKVTGTVARLDAPPKDGWQEIAHTSSRSVESMMRDALSLSDNLVMESLYRFSRRGRPSELVGNDQIRLVDGCGLSRYNAISPEAMGEVLVTHKEIVSWLPLGGQEGTLRNRFVASALENNLRAKTGTMSGVSALAGSFKVGARSYYFVLMSNGFVAPSHVVKLAEDHLLVELEQTLAKGYKPPASRKPGKTLKPGKPLFLPATNTTVPENVTVPINTTTPDNTTMPVNTTIPGNTTMPVNTTTPDNTTMPVNTTIPGNTTMPVNTTTPDNTTMPGNSTTPSNTSTPTASPTPSNTSTPTASPTPSNSSTPTESPTPSNTSTPTASPTPSNTSTPTESPTPSNTSTPTESPTPSNTSSPTESPTPSNTSTPTESPTPSNTSTPTDSPTPSNTSTPTPGNTSTPAMPPPDGNLQPLWSYLDRLMIRLFREYSGAGDKLNKT